MRCADNLLRDHDDIAAMLRVLSASVARLQEKRYVDPAMIVGIDRFMQQLVAGSHFSKESDDADIAGTWAHWPSTAGSPGLHSGRLHPSSAAPWER